jgi:hypothetical protein
MELREHSIALISVVIGLGLTDLLGNLNRLIRARREVRWSALPLVWALVALILVNNYWWGLYQGYVAITTASNAFTFLLGLSMPIMLYLLCAAALPNGRTPQGRDMAAAYMGERRYFFALVGIYIATTLLQTIIVNGSFRWTTPMVERCGLIACCVPLAWTNKLRYHWAGAGVSLAILAERLFEQVLR